MNTKTVNLAVVVKHTKKGDVDVDTILFANVGPITYSKDDASVIASVGEFVKDSITGGEIVKYTVVVPHEFYVSTRKDKHVIIKGCRCYGLDNEILYDISFHSDLVHSDNVYNYDNMICWCNYGDNLYKIVYPEYPTQRTFKIWFRQPDGATPYMTDMTFGAQHGFIVQMEFVY